jgi:hypothetical protein
MFTHKILYSLTIAFALFATGCKNNETAKEENKVSTEEVKNPATATEGGENADLPVFTFEKETHDFGTITQGEKVSYNFKFKNTGKGNLLITNASATCGCTVPDYTREPVAPGSEGVITVTFDSGGKEGKISKTVTLTANTVPNTKVLTINADIVLPKK